jgi:multidrug efflux pump subunit AcrA (membrane-fusion protein)
MSFEFKLAPEDLAKLDLPPTGPAPVRRSFRPSRRLVVGAILAILSAAVFIRSFVFTTGYTTTLVADIGIVRAPVAGVVGSLDADVGDRTAKDQTLGSIGAGVGMAAALSAASQDLGQLKAQIASIDARMAALRADAATIRAEAARYRRDKVTQLAAEGDEYSADVAGLRARLDYADRTLVRARALAEKGFISAAGLERAQQDQRTAASELAAADARLRQSRVQTSAARNGLLIGNGYSDVQYSTQRLSDIALALNGLQGERDTLAAALSSAERLTASRAGPAERRLTFPLRASLDGRVWAKLAAAGESLQEGDPIYLLASCDTFFAYFTVGRGTYADLEIGSPVTFRSFADGNQWPGRIVNMGVSNPSQLKLTGQVPTPGPDQYLIGARIDLPRSAQKDCPVGTAGRVVL